MTSRFKEIVKKYGKVALGVHFSVFDVSISGFYIGIKNNVDVESLLDKYQIPWFSKTPNPGLDLNPDEQVLATTDDKTKQLAKSAGGSVLALCNKALFPIRVPFSMASTPPTARFFSREKSLEPTDEFIFSVIIYV
ncbi:hypothetical protein Bca52824_002958 [Brassica carinata]|uniref:DUF1279 domain-containing protein n=1 Tax=Brassica carinata TaxID=52824 RepID=A0A8X8BES1_BRACI|nr:hypothetical protein Bca52824_002958 [Brassica carinata]